MAIVELTGAARPIASLTLVLLIPIRSPVLIGRLVVNTCVPVLTGVPRALVPVAVYVPKVSGCRIRRVKPPGPEASLTRQRTTVPSTGDAVTAPGSAVWAIVQRGLQRVLDENGPISLLPSVTVEAEAPDAEIRANPATMARQRRRAKLLCEPLEGLRFDPGINGTTTPVTSPTP